MPFSGMLRRLLLCVNRRFGGLLGHVGSSLRFFYPEDGGHIPENGILLRRFVYIYKFDFIPNYSYSVFSYFIVKVSSVTFPSESSVGQTVFHHVSDGKLRPFAIVYRHLLLVLNVVEFLSIFPF
jgi:hypothetical protein